MMIRNAQNDYDGDDDDDGQFFRLKVRAVLANSLDDTFVSSESPT